MRGCHNQDNERVHNTGNEKNKGFSHPITNQLFSITTMNRKTSDAYGKVHRCLLQIITVVCYYPSECRQELLFQRRNLQKRFFHH